MNIKEIEKSLEIVKTNIRHAKNGDTEFDLDELFEELEELKDRLEELKNNKVIFLDIDGVLNIMSESYRSHNRGRSYVMEEHLVKRLEFIIERTDANIVLSSSWSMTKAVEILDNTGFRYLENFMGRTSRYHVRRGEQIKDYINKHDIVNYVILEDEIFDVITSNNDTHVDPDKVIEVDMNEGLSNSDCVRAIEILNGFKTVEGVYDISEKNRFLELGYVTNVSDSDIPWKSFTTVSDSLIMRLSKDEI